MEGKKEEILLIPLCKKCPKEQHEQIYFCRCEYRNIEVARKLRTLGKKYDWKKNE